MCGRKKRSKTVTAAISDGELKTPQTTVQRK